MQPLKYSILIPTRNGWPYLKYAVESVLSQSYENFELLVSVNYSTDQSLEELRKITDSRLKLVIPPKTLSMTSHYEWLLHQAKGEWITIIGDDDGLMPYFFKAVDELISKWPKMRAFSSCSAHYFWQGYHDDSSAKILHYESLPIEKKCSSRWNLLQILAGKKQWDSLPKLYTDGIIHRSIVQTVLEKSEQKFYHELNPDVYSTVAMAAVNPSFLRISTPLFWTGSSQKSIGYSFRKRKEHQASAHADEFIKMAENDNVTVASCVDIELWRQCISQVFSYSALCSIPFRFFGFQNRGIAYLVFGSFYQAAQHGSLDLKASYMRQIASLHLKLVLLKSIAFVLRSTTVFEKLIKKLDYLIRVRKYKKKRVLLISHDYTQVPDLMTASSLINQKYS